MTGVETAAVLAPLVTEAASAAIPAAAAATAGTAAGTAAATGAGLAGTAATEAALTPALFAGADAAGAGLASGMAADTAATGGLLGAGGFGPATMGANELGLQGLSSISGAPGSAQFMTLPASQFSSAAGVGGVGPGLESTIASAVGPGASSSGGLLSTNDALRFANHGQKMLNQQPQQRGRAPMMQADAGTPQRQAQSFQSLSPYASLQGGFNPRKYGANVRKSGLLE